jgi:uncharacterized delta-60 repeat protein
MKIKFTTTVILSVVTFSVLLTFVAPRAEAQGGVPLWTNRYSDPVTGNAEGRAVAVDSNGNVFVTGLSITSSNGSDFVTIKYSSAGVPLWTNRYDGPGSGTDEWTSMAVDDSGNVVVTGISDHNGYDSFHTNYDYATIKYSNAGVPLWTNRYNGPGNSIDWATSVAVDGSGNVFVTGASDGHEFHTNYAYATIKYSSAGVPLWTNRYDGPANDSWAAALALDGNGNVFVTGGSWGTGSGQDYATIKYSNAGMPLWTNRYNGPGFVEYAQDFATSIAVDNSGNVIVTGASDRFGDPDFESYDYATIKYSNAGVPLWTNRYMSPTYDNGYANALAVDASGNVFVTGYIYSSSHFYNWDFATVAYSSAGVPLWTNRYNGPGSSEDWAASIKLDSSGNVFVTGYSYGTNNNSDFATIAYSGGGVALWTNCFHGPMDDWDAASAVAVDGSGNVIVTGWSRTTANGIGEDFVTIKYSSVNPPPVHLTIERDDGSGYFIRFTGVPDSTYRLQRAASVTGSWSTLATNTAPPSGLIEYHEASPPSGQAFYRTSQP